MIIGGASSKTFERKEKSGATMEPVEAKWIKWTAIFDDPCYGFRAFIIDSLIVTFHFGPLSVPAKSNGAWNVWTYVTVL